MLRIVLGVIAGFFAWPIALVSSELLLSALWPKFGTQQRAFQAVLENGGGTFAPETSYLVTHILCGSLAAVLAGFLAATIARKNKRSVLVVGVLLALLGVLKTVLSWPYVPLWYHLIFTAMLMPLAMIGGKWRERTK